MTCQDNVSRPFFDYFFFHIDFIVLKVKQVLIVQTVWFSQADALLLSNVEKEHCMRMPVGCLIQDKKSKSKRSIILKKENTF